MKVKVFSVRLLGALHILLGCMHSVFYWMFDWKNQLPLLSEINQGVMQLLNYYVTIFCFAMGIFLLKYAKQLAVDALGRGVMIVLLILYLARFFMEFIFPGGSVAFGLILFVFVLTSFLPIRNSGVKHVIRTRET